MNNLLIIIANYLFGWVVITLILSWLLAAGYPLFRRGFAHIKAKHGVVLTLIYSLLAHASATIALIVLTLPSLAFSFVSDHCHGANCTPHTLHTSTDSIEGMTALAIAIAVIAGVSISMLIQVFSSRRRLLTLSQLSEPGSDAYRVVQSAKHIAWCAGLLKPQVYLSSALINSVTSEQLRIILAHELTHAIRKDNLRKWILHWATITWPKRIKQRIRQALSDYSEQICDLEAAKIHNGESALNTVISTLDTCYDSKEHHLNSQRNQLKQRISALEHEVNLSKANHPYTLFSVVIPGFILSCIWIAAIVLSIHFGHPLLDRLSS